MGNFKGEVSNDECPTQWPFLYVTPKIAVVYKVRHSTQETQTDPASKKNELKKSHEKPELVGMFILLELGGRAKKTSSVRMDCIT